MTISLLDKSYSQTHATYVGSENCKKCHEENFKGWKTTLHSKMIQSPADIDTIEADFSSNDPDLTFTLEDVDLIIGSRFKQRYMKKIGDDYYLLPAQWNISTREWVKYFPKKSCIDYKQKIV